MEPITDFTTKALPSRADGCERKLLFQGKDVDLVVCGDEIVAQYKVGPSYLVISEYDYFDGVTCWFNLISTDFKLLDVVTTPDYRGLNDQIEVLVGGRLRFGFFDTADRWELAVSQKPFWSFARRHLCCRIKPFIFRRRWLELTRIAPCPD
jgi:hypothetical protein